MAGCWRGCGRPRGRRWRAARRRPRPACWTARWPSRRRLPQRVGVLREAARAEASAGRETACVQLEEALRLATDPRERAEIALEVAEAYAALFRWVDAVDVIERALAELGEADEVLAARLEGELVVCGLHDARRASRVAPVLGAPLLPLAPAKPQRRRSRSRGAWRWLLAGRPADEIAAPLEEALARAGPAAENWDTRAALLWVPGRGRALRHGRGALEPMLAEVHRSGSARVASWPPTARSACSSCGSARCPRPTPRRGSRCGCCRKAISRRGSAFAATVLADVAVEAGELDEAQALLDLLPQAGLARGRRHGARSRRPVDGCGWPRAEPAEALADFQTCAAMFGADVWGTRDPRDGLRACALRRRAGAAAARASASARASWPRPSWPTCGCSARRARSGSRCASPGWPGRRRRAWRCCANRWPRLTDSPALLERAHSLAELGAALRRAGQRAAARDPLAEALELAARCGARRWPPGRARSSRPPAPARGARGAPAWKR